MPWSLSAISLRGCYCGITIMQAVAGVRRGADGLFGGR
jgi:hypothetical protein